MQTGCHYTQTVFHVLLVFLALPNILRNETHLQEYTEIDMIPSLPWMKVF